jgi:RHS repeat-associated protein
VAGVTTRYLVDTNNLTGYAQVVEELDAAGTVQVAYAYGLDLIAQTRAGAVSYYGYDGHGSVRHLSDATGTLTDTWDYDAFGILIARTGTTPNLYLYAGEQWDADLGMYFLRARYMQPGTGRFWTMDDYEGRTGEPLSLHKYLYAANSPVDLQDPSGRAISLKSMMFALNVISVVVNLGSASYHFYAGYTATNLEEKSIHYHMAWFSTVSALLGVVGLRAPPGTGFSFAMAGGGSVGGVIAVPAQILVTMNNVVAIINTGIIAQAMLREADIHHLSTNKNEVSSAGGGPYTQRFEEIFENGGMTLEDELNKVYLPGHRGPHPEYNKEVFNILTRALKDIPAHTDQYRQILENTLTEIGTKTLEAGTRLYKLATGK